MYQILIDGRDLYYPGDEEYVITSGKVNLQLNDSGTFECGVPVSNPEYGNIRNRISMIQVLRNGKEIFYGEVRESGKDFRNTRQVYAVGELAFLFDSIQPQADYHDKTPCEMLKTWLDIHNSQVEEKKRFQIGMVTVKDSNDSIRRYTNQETTLDTIRTKLCDSLGGYLRIRKENGIRYLDLITLQEYGTLCTQSIEFGENLLDYVENASASDLYTCCIPRGAMLEESPIQGLTAYVDIKSVNSGKDYVYSQEAVDTYGWSRCVVSFEDVTEPANLKKKAEDWLKDNQFEKLTLDVTAVDLSIMDVDYESFCLGDRIPVYSRPHGMDRMFPVQSMELDLLDYSSDRLKLGNTLRLNYIDQNKQNIQNMNNKLEEQVSKSASFLQNAIANATEMILGSKGGYKLTEFDENGRWLRDLYMDAPDKFKAKNVMQVNMNGIGFSNDGYNGPYKSAWTIDGHFLADWITAGTMQADRIRGGVLQSNNYAAGRSGMKIDMDNGNIDTNHLNLGDYMEYNAGAEEPMKIGGWQIRKVDGAEYWDTIDTQKNGIGAYGPWVVWGGWNLQNPYNVDNYKFVVMENGACKAMEFLNGSRKEWKERIEKYETDALSQIRGTDVCRYKLKGRKKDGEHIGFIIGDGYNVSEELLSESGGAIDLYKAIAVAYKAIQELADIVDKKGGKK